MTNLNVKSVFANTSHNTLSTIIREFGGSLEWCLHVCHAI